MGRVKAKKPKRVRVNDGASQVDEFARVCGRFDHDSLWATLYAAAASPSARHRATSIGVALAASLRASSISIIGSKEPLPDIQELVDQAAESKGIGPMHEDYIPTDPTNFATVRVGDELLRMVPGLIERPIADLSRALRLAAAVDDQLVRRYKFGIANVVRVLLRYVDYCIETLLPHWQPAPSINLDDPIDLPPGELHAARRLVSTDPLESLQLDRADLLALEWMTSRADTATYNHESRTSPFGRTLRYRVPGADQSDRWLPPTYVAEVLAHAVSELVTGLERDNHSRRALRASCIETTRRALWRFSNTLIEGPPKRPDEILPLTGSEIQWLVPSEGPNFIAVSILFTEDLPRSGPRSIGCVSLAERVRDHDWSEGPVLAQMAGGGSVKLLPDAVVVPLVIVAGTSHLMAPQMPGQATLALEDLTWIAETATADEDLFRFARDLSSPEFPTSFGWEAINYWEPWRANEKTFFKGGISPTHMYFEAHAGGAEWDRAVELSPLEIALHGVGLPALRHAEMAEASSAKVASVAFIASEGEYDHRRGTHHAPDRVGWYLALTTPPIAIVRSDPDWTRAQHYRFLFDVCGGLIFAFDAIGESWRSAHRSLDVPGYQLRLRAFEEDVEQPDGVVQFSSALMQTSGVARSALWTFDLERFVQDADGNPRAANELTVSALEELLQFGGVLPEVAVQIGNEWRNCRPFLILETKAARTKLNHLRSPWRLHLSDQSAATSSFARRLHASGVEPGRYRGIDANNLVKDHLAPLALKELVDGIALHDPQVVVATGMEQLNRVIDHLQKEQGNLTRVARDLATDWDPVERMTELAGESLQLRQCNEIIVEAALRSEATTDTQRPTNAQRWSALLAAADAYRTVTTLSERLHHGVSPVTIEITSAFELNFLDDESTTDGSWLLEGEALNDAAASIRIGPVFDDAETSADGIEDGVDPAMLESFGAATRDVFLTLIALAQWESFEDGQSIAFANQDVALRWVYDAAGKPDEGHRLRLQSAFQMLVVSPDILRSAPWEPWQTRTRRHRLLVKPLIRFPDGTILISPQYLLTTLSVYNNQLTQGVLPWTGEVPEQVSKALAERREHRNLAFERALQRQLKDLGFNTIARVKPGDHERLGVPQITTEIDLVCGRNGDPNIWLIEAKDPAAVYGFAETARQLRAFYRDSESRGRVKPCYTTQLARKESEVRPYIEELAKKLGVTSSPDRGGHVLRSIFVTRHLTPAGYMVSRPYEVFTATQFLALVGQATD
ncbi:hypothetical protein OVN20_11205 [Microcella daejeonensis]|uniref:hypothetical protein n=1 Tax=Microcella daejeonensis TaxID=2994971 RepID=UPI00227080DD|nr:hypothetical protein [Microcella daejeonensis]WAB83609.1 hypothetical protein OVN20_11205 [Microcella daejeonensis]